MVASLIAESKTNREIAEQLEVSQRTVNYHVSNILRKLEFRNRSQIVVWYKTR
jgi:non-specific serine/threonine protein kinase